MVVIRDRFGQDILKVFLAVGRRDVLLGTLVTKNIALGLTPTKETVLEDHPSTK